MIRLALKTAPPVRIEAGHLLPERLAGLTAAEIARLPLRVGNRPEPLGDWFVVEGDAQDEDVLLEGPCGRLDRIGAGMTRGALRVRGEAGAYAGAGMTGGRITIEGAAGFGAAVAMRGGTVVIDGHAGDGLAGALPGERSGMRGGTVIVRGSAGAGLAERMRRGLVVVLGDAGPCCGVRMVAGTVLVGGFIGDHAGVAMRRGSVIALAGANRLPATFADCGAHDLVFVRLLARALGEIGLGDLAARLGPLRRWMGDLAVDGKGELLLPP